VLQQLSISARRQFAALFGDRPDPRRLDHSMLQDPMLERQAEMGSLRGVTVAAADVNECTCPEPCERDHANE
jgi:hypothetical protein